MNGWLVLLAFALSAFGTFSLIRVCEPALNDEDDRRAAVWGVSLVVAWLLAAMLWMAALPPS